MNLTTWTEAQRKLRAWLRSNETVWCLLSSSFVPTVEKPLSVSIIKEDGENSCSVHILLLFKLIEHDLDKYNAKSVVTHLFEKARTMYRSCNALRFLCYTCPCKSKTERFFLIKHMWNYSRWENDSIIFCLLQSYQYIILLINIINYSAYIYLHCRQPIASVLTHFSQHHKIALDQN